MTQPEPREEDVFAAALQLGRPERAAYLDKTCAGDPNLRQRVEALLGALDRASGLLREPIVARQSGGQSGGQSQGQGGGQAGDGAAALQTTALCGGFGEAEAAGRCAPGAES